MRRPEHGREQKATEAEAAQQCSVLSLSLTSLSFAQRFWRPGSAGRIMASVMWFLSITSVFSFVNMLISGSVLRPSRW